MYLTRIVLPSGFDSVPPPPQDRLSCAGSGPGVDDRCLGEGRCPWPGDSRSRGSRLILASFQRFTRQRNDLHGDSMTYGEFEKSPVETLLATSLAETRALPARHSKLRLYEKSHCAIVHSLPKGG